MKITVIDIETAPALVHSWGLFKANIGINQIVKPVEMLCFAAKEHGKRPVEFYSSYNDGREEMVKQAWRIIDESDVVVHYNGRTFDMPHLYREMALLGMKPPSPVKEVDLLTVVRRKLKFESRKLDFVAQQLGLGGKVKHSGFDLWIKVMNDDPVAWEKMKQYCIGDVRLEDRLYERLLPWIDHHPSVPLHDDRDVLACPRCGSGKSEKRGFYYTAVSKYQRYLCKKCEGWYHGPLRLSTTQGR